MYPDLVMEKCVRTITEGLLVTSVPCLHQVFKVAKAMAPSVIYIDEAEKVLLQTPTCSWRPLLLSWVARKVPSTNHRGCM